MYSLFVTCTEVITPQQFEQVIKSTQLGQWVFPGTIPASTSDERYDMNDPERGAELHKYRFNIEVERVEDFSIDLLPQWIWKENPGSVFIYGPDNINVDFARRQRRLKTGGSSFTMIFSFKPSHLEAGIFTYQDILDFVIQQTSIYPVAYAVLRSGIIRPNYSKRLIKIAGYTTFLRLDSMVFFGNAWLDAIGRERFEHLQACHEKIETPQGTLIVFQEEPFDPVNPDHLAREEQAIAELGLERFIFER